MTTKQNNSMENTLIKISLNPNSLVPLKISETYDINGIKCEIKDGKISLWPTKNNSRYGDDEFVFKNSTPEACEKIANVLKEAVKLTKK